MNWWLTDLNNKNAWKLLTREEKAAATKAWLVAIVIMAAIMLPLDYYLIFEVALNDVLASALSGGVAAAIGIVISAQISPRLWTILSKPRSRDVAPNSN